MVWLAPLVAVAALIGFAVVVPKQPPPGKGARDVLPPGWSGPPSTTQRVKASSGKTYDVMSWPVKGGSDYFVAQLVGDPSTWIGYIRTVSTGARKLFRAAAATPAVRDMLLSDFKVQR